MLQLQRWNTEKRRTQEPQYRTSSLSREMDIAEKHQMLKCDKVYEESGTVEKYRL